MILSNNIKQYTILFHSVLIRQIEPEINFFYLHNLGFTCVLYGIYTALGNNKIAKVKVRMLVCPNWFLSGKKKNKKINF